MRGYKYPSSPPFGEAFFVYKKWLSDRAMAAFLAAAQAAFPVVAGGVRTHVGGVEAHVAPIVVVVHV